MQNKGFLRIHPYREYTGEKAPALPVSRLYLHQPSQCPDSTSASTPSVQTLPPPALPVSRPYLHQHSQCPDSTSTKQNLTGSGSNIHFLFTTNLG
ncbi:unnamed protein product [Gadus morhua 'NCC']